MLFKIEKLKNRVWLLVRRNWIALLFLGWATIRGIGLITALVLVFVLPSKSLGQSELLKSFLASVEGKFSNEKMVAEEPERSLVYLWIRPIWLDRDDGHWFIMEQSYLSSFQDPFHCTVLEVQERDGQIFLRRHFFRSYDIFLDHKECPFPIEKFSPSDLRREVACELAFSRQSETRFEGKTEANGCINPILHGQAITAEYVVDGDFLVLWDRGWDSDGNQTWGQKGYGTYFHREGDE